MSYYLGVDIGTFESKGVLVDPEGRIAGMASRPHKMLVPRAGWAEHRPDEDWWGDFVHITKALLRETGINPKTIGAIGCSAIGPCMLPVDDDGNTLMNGVLYGVDNRAAREVAELTEKFGEERLIAECGNALTSQSVGPKILWLKRNHPEIHAKAATIHTATSYLVQKLTGERVIDHYTAANFAPLYRIADRGWSSELSEGIVDPDRLPVPRWSTEITGAVTAVAAEETGLAAGTPVITGTVDAAAEAVSVGVAAPGQMMVMYGSTIFIIMPTAERVSDPRLWYAPWLFDGQHASMAGLATSGTLTHWFRDQFARELDPDDAFPALAKEAEASPPGAKGLVMLPYFSGERTPIHDPDAKGVIFGLDLTHTRGDIYRALLEGIAYGTTHVVDTYREIGHAPKTLHAVGGGTKNRVWAQATSDVTGMRQVLREKSVGASYGDAFLAAVALGDAELADIDRWNPEVEGFAPDPANVNAYSRQYQVFRDLYPGTKALMAALSADAP
ncbi:FGGY-family carbohydrate kinase [Oricola cellulosilytica]|uniref:Carbohydrate kinase n=1 Tax=Oricola cellulosilytica TaxID=1429082 RepID=A0A4R0P8W9_9HYPH|nr:FGGY-family carbohydrate kinase [Oricola cellulosilytica]TCD12431.1 carbohydrate kinase [Oricola cellulosilytica]